MVTPLSRLRRRGAECLHLLFVGSSADDIANLEAMREDDDLRVDLTCRASLAEGLRLLREGLDDDVDVDGVVVDLDLLDSTGDDLPRLIAAAGSAPVTVIARSGDRRLTPALRAGAQGYVIREEAGPATFRRILLDNRERKLAATERRLLHRVPQLVSETRDVRTGLTLALAELCAATDWVLGAVWMPGDDGRLRRTAAWADEAPAYREFEAAGRHLDFGPDEGLPGRTWTFGKPVFVADVGSCPWHERGWQAREAGLESAIGVPVRHQGSLVGVITLYGSRAREGEHGLLQLLTTVADQLGASVAGLQAGDALAASRTQLQAVAESIGEGLFIIDAAGTVTFMNRRAEEILLLERSEVVGRPHTELDWMLTASDGASLPQDSELPVARALRTGEPAENVIVGVRTFESERSLISVNVMPDRMPMGRIRRVVCTFRDITERVRGENALRKSEALFSAAFRASPLAMSISAIEERSFLEVNPGFERLFEVTREEALGRDFAGLGVEIAETSVHRIETAIRDGEPLRDHAVRVRLASGETRDVLLCGERIELDGQDCLLAIAREATDGASEVRVDRMDDGVARASGAA